MPKDAAPSSWIECAGPRFLRGASFVMLLAFLCGSLAIAQRANADDDGMAAQYTRYHSDHFVLVTHADRDLAQARLNLLEQTYSRFYESFREAGFEPHPPRQRLIAVLFDKHDAYVHYANEADRIDMSWSNGYYSSRTNRVALVLSREDKIHFADARQARVEVEDGELLPFAEASPHAHDDAQDHAHDQTMPVITMKPISIASTAHEAAHQLAFNSGLQRRGVMYPLWVSEGLASCFEPQQLGDAFGPEFINVTRRRDLTEAMQAEALLPLHYFVGMAQLPSNDPHTVRHTYAQSWALFHFLFEQHPDKLKNYLDRLSTLRPGRRTAATMRAEFVTAFGPIDGMQAQWDDTLKQHAQAHRTMHEALAYDNAD